MINGVATNRMFVPFIFGTASFAFSSTLFSKALMGDDFELGNTPEDVLPLMLISILPALMVFPCLLEFAEIYTERIKGCSPATDQYAFIMFCCSAILAIFGFVILFRELGI